MLILVEATSALDTQTVRAIQRLLAELAAGCASLVIPHRLATIRDTDLIYWLIGAGWWSRGVMRSCWRAWGVAAAEFTAGRHGI